MTSDVTGLEEITDAGMLQVWTAIIPVTFLHSIRHLHIMFSTSVFDCSLLGFYKSNGVSSQVQLCNLNMGIQSAAVYKISVLLLSRVPSLTDFSRGCSWWNAKLSLSDLTQSFLFQNYPFFSTLWLQNWLIQMLRAIKTISGSIKTGYGGFEL